MDRLAARAPTAAHRDLITFVTDRPGHDFRYAIDCAKIATELGWAPAALVRNRPAHDRAVVSRQPRLVAAARGSQSDDATRRRGLAKIRPDACACFCLGGTGQLGREFAALACPKGTRCRRARRAPSRDLADPAAIARADRRRARGMPSSMPPPTPRSTAPRASEAAPSPSTRWRPRISRRDRAPRAFRSSIFRPTTSSTASKDAPYVETDPPAPLNVYGAQQGRRRAARSQRQSAPRDPAHVLGLQPARPQFREDDAAARRRARPADGRRRPARLPDRRARHRARQPRHRAALRRAAAKAPYGTLSFRRRRRGHLVRLRHAQSSS